MTSNILDHWSLNAFSKVFGSELNPQTFDRSLKKIIRDMKWLKKSITNKQCAFISSYSSLIYNVYFYFKLDMTI